MIDAVKNMPNVKLKIINNGVINLSDSRNLSKGKKIIIFGIPGAYTGTCSNEHLPGYIKLSDNLKKKELMIFIVCQLMTLMLCRLGN